MDDCEISYAAHFKNICFTPIVFTLAAALGLLHSYHVATMFENSRHFSHLSTLEREMTMKTEIGFYYSYYKMIVEAESFAQGAKKVTSDKLVEYPDAVNALKRFNIYPEVTVGYLFHLYSRYCYRHKVSNKQCWSIKRNSDLDDVISCEGLGEPIYFYLTFIWMLAGLTIVLLFIFSVYLSKNVSGGLLAVVCYFYNHGEATRIQWSPPLRENFAYPFIIFQTMVVTFYLRRTTIRPTEINILQIWVLGISGCMCLILWQFSQFVLITQLVIFFFMEQFRIITRQLFFLFLSGHLIGIYLAVIVMQGNKLLLSSLYLAVTCGMFLNYIMWNHFVYRPNSLQNPLNHFMHVAKNSVMMSVLSFGLKVKFSSFSASEDDSHIIQLLKTKFGLRKNFHTMLYTCSSEFDFLPLSSIWNLTMTLLLPCTLLVLFFVFRFWISNVTNSIAKIKGKNKRKHRCDDSKKRLSYLSAVVKCLRAEPEIVYNICQLFVYVIMATLIMRLKLFLTPQLCLIVSLLTTSKYYNKFWTMRTRLLPAFMFIILLVGMSLKGVQNIMSQRNTVGEFSNEPLEDLLVWIKNNTEAKAAFAGPMPITSAIMLSTRRPIVNHPHYEDSNLRARTRIVYSIFSRQTPAEVYNKLAKLKITYLVIDDLWCFYKSTKGCTMLDIWDEEEPHLKESPALCPYLYLQKSVPHFHRVFSNSKFVVFKLHDNVVNIKLRNYETYSM
ncbi:protein C-mannosyl-transferase DPY19L1 [Arctopsyche grandis]|uniref:protein C-mannosyl-transferase DPY19L1 n=1 Tax=Arctopsyche grandis TaxID=121162 RepID=UPI00406D9904